MPRGNTTGNLEKHTGEIPEARSAHRYDDAQVAPPVSKQEN